MESGPHLYSKPQCSMATRVFAMLPFSAMVFMIIWGLSNIIIAHTNIVNLTVGIFLIAAGISFLILIPSYIGWPGMVHYKIYSKGISGVYYHLSPLSNCSKL